MKQDIDLNDGTHSRFDFEHYKNCQPCAEDHQDFIKQARIDEQLDRMSERSELDYDD